MLEKIILGILIGFVGGFFLSKDFDKNVLFRMILILVSIGFIGSSLMYGVVYGLMAVGEIIVGFVIASSMFENKNKHQISPNKS